MTTFIKYEKDSKTEYVNVSRLAGATWDSQQGILVISFPGRNGGEHETHLRGKEALDAKAAIEALCP